MTVEQLYDHIVSQLTPEEALKRLLESGLINYQKLRFQEGEEIHPVMLIAMASMEMGWNFLVEKVEGEENVRGLIVGTDEYVDTIKFKDEE